MSASLWLSTFAYAAAITAVVIGVQYGRGWRARGFVLLLALGGLVAIWLVAERTLFWLLPITLAAAFSIAALVLVFHRWLTRGFILLVAFGGLVSVRLVGDYLERNEWRSIGGYVDCWPTCSRWHLVGALMHFGPGIVGLALVAVVASSAIVERRRLRFRARQT